MSAWLRRAGRKLRSEEGTAALELAILLPVLAPLAAGIIQLGAIAQVALITSNSAREGARYAAVSEGSTAVAQSAALSYASSQLSGRSDVTLPALTGITVNVTGSVPGGSVKVTVPVTVSVNTPIMRNLLGASVPLKGTATMRVSQ